MVVQKEVEVPVVEYVDQADSFPTLRFQQIPAYTDPIPARAWYLTAGSRASPGEVPTCMPVACVSSPRRLPGRSQTCAHGKCRMLSLQVELR